jgi:glutathione S-transferase
MRLHQFSFSPFAAKVRKCLELKGLPHELVEVPYLDRRALVALTGGTIQVPVLEDGERVMDESARITAYLDDRYPPSLRADPLATVLEQWADNVLEDVAFRLASPAFHARFAELQGGRVDAAAMFRLVKERKFGPGCLDAWRAAEASLSGRVAQLLEPLGRAVGARPFLLGDRASLADAAVYGQLYMLEVAQAGIVARLAPALAGWYRRVHEARAAPTDR